MLSTSVLIDSVGRAVTRDGVLPDAVSEQAGLVFVSEKATASGLGAFASALSIEAEVQGAGVIVCDTQCRVRRLDVTLFPDPTRLVPVYAQVYNGVASYYAPPDWIVQFFPTSDVPYTKRLELDDALFSLGCHVRFSAVPFAYESISSDATFRVASTLGLV